MASPPSQRLRVGTLGMLLLVAVLPASLQKCIFDEVQAQVRVVRAAPIHPDSPPNKSTLRSPKGEEHQQHTTYPGRRASPLQALPGKQPDSLGDLAPPTVPSPQPIRIRTWVPRESDSLSEPEKGRLEAAVEEAVRVVSSLLSGERQTQTLTHRHVTSSAYIPFMETHHILPLTCNKLCHGDFLS